MTDSGLASETTVADVALSFTPLSTNAGAKPVGGTSKRIADVTLALLALLILLPIFCIVAALIWRHDGKSPLFGHKRIGREGRPFRCWKFRSMVANADIVLADLLASDPEAAREWAETQKLRQDPRVTPIGRLLRASSLDELPQLINVLAGDMSLVGPRPIVPVEAERYGAAFGHYLLCRPGLTGLWQISGRSDTSYNERIRFDVQYAENWSFWRDAVIVARTIPVLLSRQGSY
jgi:exopolysaccharide production protein ExoY